MVLCVFGKGCFSQCKIHNLHVCVLMNDMYVKYVCIHFAYFIYIHVCICCVLHTLKSSAFDKVKYILYVRSYSRFFSSLFISQDMVVSFVINECENLSHPL